MAALFTVVSVENVIRFCDCS